MTMENRAAQFAPFAALSGHDDAIAETARETSRKPELSPDELAKLSRRLRYVIDRDATITIRFFEQDTLKEGGCFREVCGKVKKVDAVDGIMILADHRTIALDSILALDGEVFNDSDF